MIKQHQWVRIHSTVLQPSERAPQLPADTKKVALEMWVKGFLQEDAEIGDPVEVTTITGRTVRGTLIEHNPYYQHDYGKCLPELLNIGIQVKAILFGPEPSHD
jgi:hypothetical protein